MSELDNIRTCPFCGISVEKATGCDSIRCICGRYWCWHCRAGFNTANEAYAHCRKCGKLDELLGPVHNK